MRNYLIIAGKDSRDFGVYISGQGTFSAPQKAYQFYEVPGRNGNIIGYDHRLMNIEVSYQCFIYTNFSQNIADFRTFLLSLNGYQKLTDSYHPDEYRMAAYVGPFEPEVTSKNDAGSFTLTFNCKPQRYLVSGDTLYGWVQGGVQNLSGESITAFVPALDTSYFTGNPTGWYITKCHYYKDGVEFLTLPETGEFGNPYVDPTATGVSEFVVHFINGDAYATQILKKYDQTYGMTKITSYSEPIFKLQTSVSTFEADYGGQIRAFYILNGYEYGESRQYNKVQEGATEAATCQALLAVTKGYAIFNDALYIRDAGKNSLTAAEFNDYWGEYCVVGLYPSVIQHYYFTPVDLSALNVEWATFSNKIEGFRWQSGVTPQDHLYMRYGVGSDVRNPTMFPSSPLIRAYGTGKINLDGVTITISSCSSYVDIDCDLMDCYEGSTNRNNDVSFSTYDFPKLQPGENEINIISGVTQLAVTPRWWRV